MGTNLTDVTPCVTRRLFVGTSNNYQWKSLRIGAYLYCTCICICGCICVFITCVYHLCLHVLLCLAVGTWNNYLRKSDPFTHRKPLQKATGETLALVSIILYQYQMRFKYMHTNDALNNMESGSKL